MTMSNRVSARALLLAAATPLALLTAAPAFAQAASPQTPPPSDAATPPNTGESVAPAKQGAQPDSGGGDIVVTGTLFGRDTVTPSPVTVVTVDTLDRRGISTIQEGLQTLAANNGPALTNSFTANGAFAAGASAVSLRGLSTNSTLVLFDGMRAAYYPLADDGSRNFVDLNTIPDDIVERIEVLKDGASSSYGADAIAGVVNIITKREVKGLTGRAEAGVSSRGDASQYRLSLTGGVGDLDRDGINAYISGNYYKSNPLYNSQRPYPYNSSDQRDVCAPGVTPPNANGCGPNNVTGGLNSAGQYVNGTPTGDNFLVRPYNAANTAVVPGSRYQNLDLGNNCSNSIYTLTAADLAANPSAPTQLCQVDGVNRYGVIQPQIERFGASGRVTAKVGGGEAYLELNFLEDRSSYTGGPAQIYGAAPTGINYPQFRDSGAGGPGTIYAVGSGALALPIYVCPRNGQAATLVNGVATAAGGCTAATPGATLNPNNPFAAAGEVARLIGVDLNTPTFNETRDRSFRAAGGIKGHVTDWLTYDVNATAMHTDLRVLNQGYVFIQHLIDEVADGSYNFTNPAANSTATLNYLKPTNVTNDSSDEYQAQVVLGAKLFDLPGGPLQLGVGGSFRYEAVNAASANNDINGPTQRYFTLNAFGTNGSREVYSAFGELDAPIITKIDIKLSGRYDNYSTGQDYFSPKVGATFTPIRQITFRGTYSKGFRIPSFGEANALPTTGYVTNQVSNFTDAFLSQYGCTKATYAQCPTYITAGSYGLTQLASPNLAPEKSRSFTAGVVLRPTSRIKIDVGYYDIKKTGAITFPSTGPALTAYYAGQAIPGGFTVLPNAPDINHPNATPTIAFIQGQLINANTVQTNGLDIDLNADIDLPMGIRLSSSADATLIFKLYTRFADGSVERYDGTLGNFNLTAGSGTPKWHANWVNTFSTGDFGFSVTANYISGYDLSAQDQGTGYEDGSLNPGYSPSGNRVKSYTTVDLNAQVKVNNRYTFYFDILNVADRLPPIDVVTYGANLYNPVTGGDGILGRYFKAGIKVGF